LGDAVTAIRQAAAANVPATMSTMFQGTAQAFQDSLNGLGLILLMAIVVIYIVLGVLYESFTHPLTILSGLPSAGFGPLLTLYLTPVYYVYIEGARLWLAGRGRAKAESTRRDVHGAPVDASIALQNIEERGRA